jgi:hypothetical protein
MSKSVKELLQLNYNIKFKNKILFFQLKNEIFIKNEIINNIFNKNKEIFKSNYYKEILYFIYYIKEYST